MAGFAREWPHHLCRARYNADGSPDRVPEPRALMLKPMLSLGVALAQSSAVWQQRHRVGLVPDASPYGLDGLERRGIQPVFDDTQPQRTTAERVLNRLTGWDWAGGRPERMSPVDAFPVKAGRIITPPSPVEKSPLRP